MRATFQPGKTSPSNSTVPLQRTGAANRRPASTSTNQHKQAKKMRNRVPPPQQERIRQKYIAGKSIVQISKEEGRNRETVTRIVHSEEMCEYVKRMREAFYALVDSALATVRYSVEEKKDGNLAYKLLADTGVVPTAVERQQIQMSAKSKSDDDAILLIATKLFAGSIHKLRFYGYDTSEDEEKLAKAGGRVDEEGDLVPITKSGKD